MKKESSHRAKKNVDELVVSPGNGLPLSLLFSPFQIIKKSYVALRPETCSDVPTLGTKLMRLLKSRLIRCGPSGPVVLMSSDISKFCRR